MLVVLNITLDDFYDYTSQRNLYVKSSQQAAIMSATGDGNSSVLQAFWIKQQYPIDSLGCQLRQQMYDTMSTNTVPAVAVKDDDQRTIRQSFKRGLHLLRLHLFLGWWCCTRVYTVQHKFNRSSTCVQDKFNTHSARLQLHVQNAFKGGYKTFTMSSIFTRHNNPDPSATLQN